jgi:phosphopantothenoylcysteine decarboxylase/phosphopantothenate--cysteine ligase
MYNEVMKYKDADIIIMTAAVSDYKPKKFESEKIKKNDSDFILELDRNKDILYELGKIKNNQILVGFAAETTNVEEYAIKKLKKKNLDLIVANDVSKKNIGFGTDLNKVIFFDKYGNREEFEEMSKDLVAGEILNKIIDLIKSR